MAQGVAQFHDPKLLAGGPDDDPHFASANAVVDSNLLNLDSYTLILVGQVVSGAAGQPC